MLSPQVFLIKLTVMFFLPCKLTDGKTHKLWLNGLIDILCNQDIFDTAKATYEEALHKTCFNEELKYKNKDSKEQTRNEEKSKKRTKIIWFNPPFSLSVKANIGKLFFKLLKKHFPKSNPLSKIFNKNTIKISYSCTRNMKSIMSSHNKKILTPKNKQVRCNCT